MRVSPASFFFRCAQNEQKKKPRVFLFYFIGGRPTGLIRRKIQKYLPSLNSPPSRKDFFVFFIFFVKECPALYDVIRFGQKNKTKRRRLDSSNVFTQDTNSQTIEMCERKRRPRPTVSLFGDFFRVHIISRVCVIFRGQLPPHFFGLSRELLLLYTPL
jgi:hypothetical protein